MTPPSTPGQDGGEEQRSDEADTLVVNIYSLSGHLDARLDGIGRTYVSSLRWLEEYRRDYPAETLAAVAPDLVRAERNRVRGECAEELRAELERISEKSRPGNPKIRDLEHVSYTARLVAAGQLRALVASWSTPDPGEPA